MENTRNKPTPRRLPLAVYLAFLLAVVLAFTGTTAASFKTQSSAGDGARVARFDVSAVSDEKEMNLKVGETQVDNEYSFTIKSNIEVTAKGKISVTGVPAGVSVSFQTQSKVSDGAPIYFETGVFQSGDTVFTLVFEPTDAITENIERANIGIEFTAEQID